LYVRPVPRIGFSNNKNAVRIRQHFGVHSNQVFIPVVKHTTWIRTGMKRVQILVRDNNVDQALRALKKKMQREGIFREMKLRGHFEKPSEKKAREKAEAVRRARKLARKHAQREGLLTGRSGRR
jgi:small subunit ribosomal protein S21